MINNLEFRFSKCIKEMKDQTLIIPDLHEHEHKQNRFAVIPTAEKLNAEKELTGKGVSIAFSGFGFFSAS